MTPAEAEGLAHMLAAAKGKPVAAILREPSRRAPARPASCDEERKCLLEISDRSGARPVLDARDPDVIIGHRAAAVIVVDPSALIASFWVSSRAAWPSHPQQGGRATASSTSSRTMAANDLGREPL